MLCCASIAPWRARLPIEENQMASIDGWSLSLLGAFQLEHDGKCVTQFARRRQDVLLGYLALTPTQAHARRAVAHLLWPGKAHRYALNRLTEVLTLLNKQLDGAGVDVEVVAARYQTIQLGPGIRTDVQGFDDLMAMALRETEPARRMRLLERVVEAHGAGLLPVLDDPWVVNERARLERARDQAAQLLAQEAGSLVGAGAAGRSHLAQEDVGRYLARGSQLMGAEGGHGEPRIELAVRETVAVPDVGHGGEVIAAPRAGRQLVAACLNLVELAEPHLAGPDRQLWLDRLDRERSEIYEAIEWALEHKATEQALRLTGALWRYWLSRLRIDEGRLYLDQAMALAPRPEGRWYARVANGAGSLALQAGDPDYAGRRFLEALAIWRAHEDAESLGRVLTNLGIVAYKRGDRPEARRWYRESIGVLRQTRSLGLLTTALKDAALVEEDDGLYGDAEALLAERLAIGRQLEDRTVVASSLIGLAALAEHAGSWAELDRLTAEARPLFEAQGDLRGVATCLRLRGYGHQMRGQPELARSFYESSLSVSRALKDVRGTGESLRYIAATREAEGDKDAAIAQYRRALLLLEDVADQPGIAQARGALAGLEQGSG
jgi:tetratricopeptide (TPR) repeat protein